MTKIKNKKIFFVLFLFIFTPVLGLYALTPANAALTSSNAHKAIVQIFTYYEDSNYVLTLGGSGSGVFISQDGLILTNKHVVENKDEFGNIVSSVFKICVTENTTTVPECSYSASLVAKNEDTDIALLQLTNVNQLAAKTSFDFLSTNLDGNRKIGEEVKALGYPSIGGKTITTTKGTITGTSEEHDLSWIKTDASISFGSSGGALIDSQGSLLGITTAAHADFLASMGYVIDIASINDWIGLKSLQSPTRSVLQDRMDNLIRKQKNLNKSDLFSNTLPNFTISKNSDWIYTYDDETTLGITSGDAKSILQVSWIDAGVPQENRLNTFLFQLETLNKMTTIIKHEYTTVDGIGSLRIVQNMSGTEITQLIVPIKNYVLIFTYSYNDDENIKEDIDAMIASVNISTSNINYIPERSYFNKDPQFSLVTGDNFTLVKHNSVTGPITIFQNDMADIEVDTFINKLTNTEAGLSNEDYYLLMKNNDYILKTSEANSSLKAEEYETNLHYKINDELDNEIFIKYRFLEENSENVRYYMAAYRVRTDNDLILIYLVFNNNNIREFEKYRAEFESSVLSNLKVPRTISHDGAPSPGEDNNIPPLSPATGSTKPARDLSTDFAKKQIGKILLQVEGNGEAWYISPRTNKAYYLGRPAEAFSIMREEGIGITNVDLQKIPIGLSENMSGDDNDNDGLSNIFEDAIGTNKNMKDSDGDTYSDKAEIQNGYSPTIRSEKAEYNYEFAAKNKGKIFLQVQNGGEAWYVNPNDSKRYFLGRPQDAFSVMRNLGVGISEKDFENIK